jgi:hypothetical protein
VWVRTEECVGGDTAAIHKAAPPRVDVRDAIVEGRTNDRHSPPIDMSSSAGWTGMCLIRGPTLSDVIGR